MTGRRQWQNVAWAFARWALRSGERVCTLPHDRMRGGRCPSCKAAV